MILIWLPRLAADDGFLYTITSSAIILHTDCNGVSIAIRDNDNLPATRTDGRTEAADHLSGSSHTTRHPVVGERGWRHRYWVARYRASCAQLTVLRVLLSVVPGFWSDWEELAWSPAIATAPSCLWLRRTIVLGAAMGSFNTEKLRKNPKSLQNMEVMDVITITTRTN